MGSLEGKRWQDFVLDGDLELISRPIDFLGVNFYHGDVQAGPALRGRSR